MLALIKSCGTLLCLGLQSCRAVRVTKLTHACLECPEVHVLISTSQLSQRKVASILWLFIADMERHCPGQTNLSPYVKGQINLDIMFSLTAAETLPKHTSSQLEQGFVMNDYLYSNLKLQAWCLLPPVMAHWDILCSLIFLLTFILALKNFH